MTYGQAKKDFVIFAVFAYVKNKRGKTRLENVDLDKEKIADDAEGRVGVYPDMELLGAPRLCFILKETKE